MSSNGNVTYSKGDRIKLMSDNFSYGKHPTEHRDLINGDVITVESFDKDDQAIVYNIEYSTDPNGGRIWIFLDMVELLSGSVSSSSGTCTCEMSVIMSTGCVCGAIKRHKDK